MTWFKNRQVHDDWVESFDWGTRCLICGGVRTDRARRIDAQIKKCAYWGLWISYMSLLLSILILLIAHPVIVSELLHAGQRAATQISDVAFWFVVYCFFAMYSGWILRRFFGAKAT